MGQVLLLSDFCTGSSGSPVPRHFHSSSIPCLLLPLFFLVFSLRLGFLLRAACYRVSFSLRRWLLSQPSRENPLAYPSSKGSTYEPGCWRRVFSFPDPPPLRIYLSRTNKLLPHPRTLFVSPKMTHRPLSKNALSFFLREVISQSEDSSSSASGPSGRVRAHSIRGVATSVSFHKNVPVQRVLEAACWKSASVFSSFYLKDVAFSHEEGFGLGPFVAAQAIVS